MAQNIDNKKTTLSDDASIYQKKEERESSESVKNNWSNLHGKEKAKYFKDYLLIPILVGIVVVIAVFFFVRSMFKEQAKIGYSVAVISTKYLDNDSLQKLVDEMEEFFAFEDKEKVDLEIGLGKTANAGMSELMTELMAGTLDMIIGTEKDLDDISAYFAAFDDDSTVLALVPEESRVSMIREITDSDGNPGTESVICGIKLKDTVFSDCIPEGSRYKNSLIAVFVRTSHNTGEKSRLTDCVRYVMGQK